MRSTRAARALGSSWRSGRKPHPSLSKLCRRDYRRVLEALEEAEAKGLVGDEALMAAFEANKNDAARVSGN